MINLCPPELHPEAVVLTGMSGAVIGISECGRLVYSVEKILGLLESDEEMSSTDAQEWYNFNILPLMAHLGGFILSRSSTPAQAEDLLSF